MSSGRSACFGNCLPCQPEGSQTCLVWGNAHQPLPAFGKRVGSGRRNQHPEMWAASGFGGEAVTLILCDMIQLLHQLKSLAEKVTEPVFEIGDWVI